MKFPLLLALAAAAAPVLADNLTHIRIRTPDARAVAARLEREGYDVLEGSIKGSSFEVIASDGSLAALKAQGLAITTIAIGRPYAQIQAELLGDGPGGYPTLAQINDQLAARAASFPALCQLVDLTTTHGVPATAEGRHIMAVKISDNASTQEDEPSFLLAACHHAREIGTPVVALDTIDRLLNGYGGNPQITAAVNKYEIWIAPVWNPDGYNYVFTTNNLWRKNRRPNPGGSFGVDLNRNYPFGWTAACAGSTTPSSDTYKGPSAGSEPETQTMRALGLNRNLDKMIDYHSYGRETLYGYLCLTHPLSTFLSQEAAAVSAASGYGGVIREPSAEGEDQESHMAFQGTLGFLTEIGTAFQPTYASSVSEAALVWGGTFLLLNRPISITGHVTSAATGQPVVANITINGINFLNGETSSSRGPFGRYHAFLPVGTYTLNYSAPGYLPANRVVIVGANTETTVDVPLVSLCYSNCDGSTAAPILNVADFACFLNRFAAGDPYANCDGSTSVPTLNVADFACFLNSFAAGCT